MTASTTASLQKQRAVRGLPFTASYTFGLDNDALPDADTTVSVAITNAAGDSVASGEATLGSVSSGLQAVTFDVAADLTPARDSLTATWTATIGGAQIGEVSTIDVCDARLFPMSDYQQYPEVVAKGFADDVLEAQRLFAEDFLERECGCAFTGRYGTETFDLGGYYGAPAQALAYWWGGRRVNTGATKLALRQPFIQALRSIAQTTFDPDSDTSTTTQLDVSYARFDSRRGTVEYRDQLGNGLRGNVTIGFEHGEPLADVRRICAILARYRLLNGPLDARASQVSVEGGGTINLLTPGIAGSVTGIAEVDAFIMRYNQRAEGFLG